MISLPGLPPSIPTTDQLATSVAAKILSDDMPPSEAVEATPGTAPKARRADSRNKRLTSQTQHVSTAGGTTRVMFTRKFTQAPGVLATLIEAADNGPAEFKVTKFVTAAGADWSANADQSVEANQIAGCDIYWYRIAARPNLGTYTPLTLATFLFGTLNGLLSPIFAALQGQPNWSPLAANVSFTCTAVASSQAPVT